MGARRCLDAVTGTPYVLDSTGIWSLSPGASETYDKTFFFDTSSVDPTHFPAGGFLPNDGVIFYLSDGPSDDDRVLHAVAIDTGVHTEVLVLPDTPGGLAIDPAGDWLYLTTTGTPGTVFRIDRGEVFDSPVPEVWISGADLHGATDLLGTEMVLP